MSESDVTGRLFPTVIGFICMFVVYAVKLPYRQQHLQRALHSRTIFSFSGVAVSRTHSLIPGILRTPAALHSAAAEQDYDS